MIRKLNREHLIREYAKGIEDYDFEYQRLTNDNTPVWVNLLVKVCKEPGKDDIIGTRTDRW